MLEPNEVSGLNHRRFSYARVCFWITTGIIGYFLGWLESKAFISILSIWALVETSWAAARADSPTPKDKDKD